MKTLLDLLATSAARDPARTALVMRAGVRIERLTYADLERRAHAYARLLRERRVVPGDRVVIWAPNQPDWVACLFGSLLVGAVVVPLDVRSSREFVERVVGQTEPVLGFTGRQEAPALRELEVPVLSFGEIELTLDGKVEPAPVGPDSLAEIIFTSGTTGDPKGVMLTHGNVVANVKAGLQIFAIAPTTRMLSLLPLSHMFEQTGGCFAPLSVGAAIAYPASRQPASLVRLMQEWRPTMIMAVPQALALLMGGIEREAAATGRLSLLHRLRAVARRLPRRGRRLLFRSVLRRFGGALDVIVSGGAPLDAELQAKWQAMGVDVVEGYGTTECSPVVTGNPRERNRPGSVGVPLPGEDVRVAADGEVLVRGPNVFAGYWRSPDATAAAFIDDWYCTGDLGAFEDGYLYLKGRKKDLIVLPDGQNVYPEDIEDVLRRQPGVTDAVVVGREEGGRVRLHAAVVEGEAGAAARAVATANIRLSDHQQIHGFTCWPQDDFPRTHTLKVRRAVVLAALEDAAALASTPPPAGPETDPLLRLVAQCTGRDEPVADNQQLGQHLGLDSLGRVELLSTIEEELGVYVDDTEVGPHTTVADLRTMVEHSGRKPTNHHFPTWPRWRLVGWIRRFLQGALLFPAIRLGYRLEVRGRANLRAVREPCLIVSNHNMHLDQALLLRAMPSAFRRRVAIAAAASDIFGNRVRGFGSALLGNAFPFAKEGSGVRESLEYVARMLDDDWHVLIFPEGRLTVMGPMKSFKSGIGLLAAETGAPVLPMRIDVLRPGFYEGKWFPHPRARVRVTIGSPVHVAPGTSYTEATARLEDAVRNA